MYIGAAFIVVSTFISTFTPRAIGGFIASRALTGIGQGLAMPAGPVYINEIAPANDRGMIMSLWQLFFGFGSFMAYWINYACSGSSDSLGDWDWRIVMLGQLIGPIVIIAGLFFCPESPRWLVASTLDTIPRYQVGTLVLIIGSGTSNRIASRMPSTRCHGSEMMRTLFRRRYRKCHRPSPTKRLR